MSPEDRLRQLRDPERWTGVRVPRATGPTSRPRTAPSRVVPLVAAFAIAIVTVIGIATGLGAWHRHDTPPAATRSASATPSTGPTTGPGFTVVPGAVHDYSPARRPPSCTAEQLQTDSTQPGGGAAGSYVQTVFVRDTGGDCLLAADTVRVGDRVAPLQSVTGPAGLIVPAGSSGGLRVETASACQPTGATSNVDPRRLVLPISLRLGDATRTTTARFPRSRCTQPFVDGELDADDAARFHSALSAVSVTVDPADATASGRLDYRVSLEDTGRSAIVLHDCPGATEVLDDGRGRTVTRALALRCPPGAVLQPDVPVTIDVATAVPAAGDWTIGWFLHGGATAVAASTTCDDAQLQVSEPGAPDVETAQWVQRIGVRDRGAACVAPASAFSVGGRTARAGATAAVAGIRLAADSTTTVLVGAATTCADGSPNIAATRDLVRDAKPIVLSLEGVEVPGLDRPFPALRCAGPFVEPLP